MTRREFLNLVAKANESDGDVNQESPLYGISLHRDRVMVTEAGAIAFINYHCRYLTGEWAAQELEDMQVTFQRVDLIPTGERSPVVGVS